MTTGSIVCGVFAALWGLDALRLRGRAGALTALAASDAPVSGSHRFLVRPGVTLDEATRRAASAHARANDLDVLDLVPADLEAWRAMVLLQSVDPARFRKDRLAKGRTAGDAILVDASVLARMATGEDAPADPVLFAELAARLKQHACTRMDLAVAPSLRAARGPFAERGRLVRSLYGDMAFPVVLAQVAFALSAPLLGVTGAVALAVLNLQCVIATLGTKLHPRGRALYTFFREFIDVASIATFYRHASEAARVEPLRPEYASLLSGGTARFFEPRREDCPICGGTVLTRSVSSADHFQFKPGTFTLERCAACDHVFQNPRLSIEGLGFYYKDFYDGLGERRLEDVFGLESNPYVARASIVQGRATPSRWLDVGAGHGHFCCVARSVWPEARFDGLDLSDSIDHAVARNWVDRGYRGLFPDLAPELRAERYDVVSMSHYLEHTRDPKAEIEAASHVLGEGGLLMIEVPDPDCRLSRVLGSYWMPWFQPQHQHLLSARNLERVLREHAFEPLVWHRGEAHQTTDLTFLAYTLLAVVARPIDLPWRAPTSMVVRAWSVVVWWLGIPLLAISWLLDHAMGPFFRRAGWSNTYRVLARRTA